MLYNRKIGLAISSYINNDITFNIQKESLKTLLKTTNIIDKIILIDDGSFHRDIDNYYNSIKHKIQIIKNKTNKGISITKNIGLSTLKDCDIIILSDNDNTFLKDWDKFYIDNFIKSEIKNVNSSNIFGDDPAFKIESKNNIKIGYHKKFQGNFIIIDKEILQNVGAFPVLPEKYGCEHFQYQNRINKYLKREQYSYDFVDSNKYVQNIYKSYTFTNRMLKDNMSRINAQVSDRLIDSGIIKLNIEENIF
jgi:hypothetical protein